jgi:hypothetical protein
MSNWYDGAQRRHGQRQQQEELQQQQTYKDLLRILEAADARQKLEYIRQAIWGYGQIDPFQRKHDSQVVITNNFPYETLTLPAYSEAGLNLHFEYEVLKFVVEGGTYDDSRPPRFVPESKDIDRSTVTRRITISATHNDHDGRIQMYFEGKRLSTPLSNFAALVEELDDTIYLYCQTTHSLTEEKAQQDQKNRHEEERYRRYKPRKKP